MDEYLSLIMRFNRNPNLCNWFQLCAYDTWRRIEFARNQRGLRIFETTITQNILYEFAIYKLLYNLNIDMYESADEEANGNDIEFEYTIGDQVMKLPMQAKIIYRDGRYPRMEHGSQIETLINYAEREGGYPLYILYNYYNDIPAILNNRRECGVRYNVQQYGISLVSAFHLHDNYYQRRINRNNNLAWRIPHFLELHPDIAIPWFKLACCKDINGPEDIINFFKPKNSPDRPKNLKTFKLKPKSKIESKKWRPLNLEKFVGEKKQLLRNVDEIHSDTDSLKNKEQVFNPKYRICINVKGKEAKSNE